MVSNNKTIRVVALLVGVAIAFVMVGLHAQQGDQFAKPMKVDYKNPGINFSQYDSLLINDLDVSNTKIVPPPWKADKPFKWEVSAKNVTALQAAFRESMHDQISANGGYPIVTEPGSGVMEISVRIVSFMPYADRKEEVTTRGSGEMRIHVETRDAQSEELIAIYEGPQEVGQDYGPNSDFARQENLKALFDFWGQRIRIAMDKGRN
jgi:hypothetical protein